jgi:hypothetical protein
LDVGIANRLGAFFSDEGLDAAHLFPPEFWVKILWRPGVNLFLRVIVPRDLVNGRAIDAEKRWFIANPETPNVNHG